MYGLGLKIDCRALKVSISFFGVKNKKGFREKSVSYIISTARVSLLRAFIKTIIGAVNKCLKVPTQGSYIEFF
jgi:hypothetical protein